MTYSRQSVALLTRPIAMLIFPGCEIVDVTGPMDVFCFANLAMQRMQRIKPGEQVYSLTLLAEQAGPVATSSGMRLVADRAIADVADSVDTLMIAGAPTLEALLDTSMLWDWIAGMLPRVRRMVSICTGAFLLAESGLLEGRRATTHWLFCEEMNSRYRGVTLEPDKIFIRDGVIYTSGGVTAGIDLALSLVEEDWGWEVANMVARAMLIFMRRPGGQSQFSGYAFREAKTRKDFRALQAWIATHLQADLSVEALAEQMAMSPRNFSRLFCHEIGLSPAKFVERIRLEAARAMLLRSDSSMEGVAAKCGFSNAEQMRRAFQRRLKITPQEYRANFK